jgi:hypothetical protein
MAFFEAEGVMLPAGNAKVQLIAFDPITFALDKPAALLSRIGEGRENALRLDGIAALNDKCVVNYGHLVHGFLSSKGIVKYEIKYLSVRIICQVCT